MDSNLLTEGIEMTIPEFKPIAWTNKQGDYFEAVRKDTVFGSHTRPLYTSDQLAEAANLIERQAAQIEMMREALSDIADDYEDRFDMNSPSTNPGMRYVVKQSRAALSATPDQALERFAAKVREQCEKACESEYVTEVDADDAVYNSAITHALRAIRAFTEIPK